MWGGVVTLVKEGKHSVAKRREHNAWPLAPEKIAAELAFKKLYGARQRRLSDMALLCRAREIQRPRDGQEVPDLVHFHARVPRTVISQLSSLSDEDRLLRSCPLVSGRNVRRNRLCLLWAQNRTM